MTEPARYTNQGVTIVVVVHNMARELPRTLRTLSPSYQRGVDADDYEVIVVDNGSAEPVDQALIDSFEGNVRLIRLNPAPPSPALAANTGIRAAAYPLIGLIIDGARMASPGLVAHALLGARVAPRPVIATAGFHLGSVRHMDAVAAGYDQATEDQLLRETDWEADGYRLFSIATLAASSGRGWFGPMGESSALFLPSTLWAELDGLDEQFSLPGGGLVNHDLYQRSCALPGAQLVMVLGEGTFHQVHGGAATSRRFGWDEMHAQYVSLRGHASAPPSNEPIYVGSVSLHALGHLAESVRLAVARAERLGIPGQPA